MQLYHSFLLTNFLFITFLTCDQLYFPHQYPFLFMQEEIPENYCGHFQNLKSVKKVAIPQTSFCKFCMSTNCPLWICLHKNCRAIVCGKANHSHLSSHHEEQLKKENNFHCVFMNIHTAEIRCQCCHIEILDIDQLEEDELKNINTEEGLVDPMKFRVAILPFLQKMGESKIMGQLEFPQGHRKINRGLVGIFADKQNYSALSGVQLMAQCGFFKDIILSLKLKQQSNNKLTNILRELKNVVKRIQEADSRAVRIDNLMKLMMEQQPSLKGYKRKDPFDTVLEFLNLLHEYLNFYKIKTNLTDSGTVKKDQWDMFYKTMEIETHCPIYDSLVSTLSLDYNCPKCFHFESFTQQINFIKLDFPKKRRKQKIIEKELTKRGYETPKKRGKSLMSYILPQEQLPITIPQLLIDFFKQPLHKQKNCPRCNDETVMRSGKVEFKKIADILILQINRMPRSTDQVVDTRILLNYQNINLSPFLMQQPQSADNSNKSPEQRDEMSYQFLSAIGIQKGLFPVVFKSRYNNQLYVMKNEAVEMLSKKEKINPYVVCLKRLSSHKTTEFYDQIVKQSQTIVDLSQSLKLSPSSNLQKSSEEKQFKTLKNKLEKPLKSKCFTIPPPVLKPSKKNDEEMKSSNESSDLQFCKIFLPDFYHIQLKHGIQLPVYNPMVCKHGKVKPNVQRKCTEQISITEQMYRHLIKTFGGITFQSEICTECQAQLDQILKRKNKEKQLIKDYDLCKTKANVIVSMAWLKKWSNYLYSQQSPSYFHKGYPFPPVMDNTVLLQNGKCRSNLVKNRDFKVVNILVYNLLRQLYSGGPQIRYKWKGNGQCAIQDSKLRQIKMQAAQLKSIYTHIQSISPKRSSILCNQRSNSPMETVNQTQNEDEVDVAELKLADYELTNLQ